MRITLADIPSPPNRTGSIPVLFGPTLEGIPPTPVPPCKILVHFGPTLEGIPHTPVPLGKITVGTGLTPVVFPATLGGSGYTPMLLLEICGKKAALHGSCCRKCDIRHEACTALPCDL